jgi:hypothetical protein
MSNAITVRIALTVDREAFEENPYTEWRDLLGKAAEFIAGVQSGTWGNITELELRDANGKALGLVTVDL